MDTRSNPPTLDQIAQKAGVSRSTVSRALNDHPRISEKRKAEIREIARSMGYEASASLSDAMRHVRSSGRNFYRKTIACIFKNSITNHTNPASKTSPDFQQSVRYTELFRDLGEVIGCHIDFFALEDTSLRQISKICKARNIDSVIFIQNVLRPYGDADRVIRSFRRDFHCVFLVLGDVRYGHGTYIQTDFFEAGRICFAEGWKAGYRQFYITRLTHRCDSENRFAAGMHFAAGTRHLAHRINEEPAFHEGPYKHSQAKSFFDSLDSRHCVVGAMPSEYYPVIKERLTRPDPPGVIDWQETVSSRRMNLSRLDRLEEDQARRALVNCLKSRELQRRIAKTTELIQLEPVFRQGISLPKVESDSLNLLSDEAYPEANVDNMQTLDIARVIPSNDKPPNNHVFKSLTIPAAHGLWKFHNVPFQLQGNEQQCVFATVGSPSADRKRNGILQVRRRINISVGYRARFIIFLHAAFGVQEPGPFARYRIHYHSHPPHDIPIVAYGKRTLPEQGDSTLPDDVNILDGFYRYGCLETPQVKPVQLYRGKGYFMEWRYLYTYRCPLPHPRSIIESLEIIAEPDNHARLLLYGVTLEE